MFPPTRFKIHTNIIFSSDFYLGLIVRIVCDVRLKAFVFVDVMEQ